MALRRFWVEPDFFKQTSLTIEGDLFHHIRDVCRFDAGDSFELISGDGLARLVRIESCGKKSIQVVELSQRTLATPQKPWVELVVCVPKFQTLELILEKCVELGVRRVTLAFSKYSFVRSAERMSASKMQRWDKIILSATQQSGRGDKMELRGPLPLFEVAEEINRRSSSMGLFLYEGEAQEPLYKKLEKLGAPSNDHGLEWIVPFIGSEGGFSIDEVQKMQELGFTSLGLGDQILRVETACVALASILKYEQMKQRG